MYVELRYRGIRNHIGKVDLPMILSFFHYYRSKFPIQIPQNLTFFGPDFVPQCSPSKFWLRGHSQTTFTAMGGGGVSQMSTLLNKFSKFY